MNYWYAMLNYRSIIFRSAPLIFKGSCQAGAAQQSSYYKFDVLIVEIACLPAFLLYVEAFSYKGSFRASPSFAGDLINPGLIFHNKGFLSEAAAISLISPLVDNASSTAT